MATGQAQSVELSVSEQGELRSLRTWLASNPSIKVSTVSGQPPAGGLGHLDALLVTAASGTVMTAIRTLPRFIHERKSHTSITVKVKNRRITFQGDNAEEAMHILEKLLDE